MQQKPTWSVALKYRMQIHIHKFSRCITLEKKNMYMTVMGAFGIVLLKIHLQKLSRKKVIKFLRVKIAPNLHV